MKVIEQSIIPKSPKKKSEDGIVVTDDFIALIDGSTSKRKGRYNLFMSNGRYAMRLISRYIKKMPAEITCREFCKGVSKMILSHYFFHPPVVLENYPQERLCASAILYSRMRREVWMVGDCQCLIGEEYYDNPKPYEAELAELRASYVREMLKQGTPREVLLREPDPAREKIIPRMIETMRNQNKTYAVIDGFPIPAHRVPVITLGFQPFEIVFASDGYPFLRNTLAASEQLLEEQRQKDPLNIGEFKATKGFYEGNNSFDDRAYIRFTV